MNLELKTDSKLDKVTAFATSEVFERIFSEGMDLVEETAHYLDGDGRNESKKLERAFALAYASESMRLTTRLMQAASWLLVQRAIREGEMSAKDAHDPKYRLGAKAICAPSGNNIDELPVKLRDLLLRSESIYTRIERLDEAMFRAETEQETQNPLDGHFARIQAAFGGFND